MKRVTHNLFQPFTDLTAPSPLPPPPPPPSPSPFPSPSPSVFKRIHRHRSFNTYTHTRVRAEIPVAERARRSVHAQRRAQHPPFASRRHHPHLLPRCQVQHPAQVVPSGGIPKTSAHLLRAPHAQHDNQARAQAGGRERAGARALQRPLERTAQQPV